MAYQDVNSFPGAVADEIGMSPPDLRVAWIPAGLSRLLQASKTVVGAIVASAILTIAITDWWVGLNLSLGAVYVIPILLAAAVYSRTVIVLLAILCSVLRLAFGEAVSPTESVLNFLLVMAAYVGSGFFIREVVDSRTKLIAFASQLQHQRNLRRQAEEQLRILVESSPAAIMTVDQDGRILASNQAAMSLFGADSEQQLSDANIAKLLPVLNDALRMADSGESFRTAAQCQGRRLNGTPFHAHIWFSTYATAEGRRLAAIAVDSSDEIRDREESALRQLLTSNRVLTAAVLHEIRNLCGAITTAYANLASVSGDADHKESQVLGNMIEALGRLASANLQGTSRESLAPVRLPVLLDQFRIVAEPAWQEIEGSFEICIDADLPPAVADPQGLIQVLLNLMSNSVRAMEDASEKRMSITAAQRGNKIVLSVTDSGPGIPHPEKLFVPFQSGAERVGLGLYLSRALMRSFGGELRHVPTPTGCRFELELVAVDPKGDAHVWLT
jgi:PAS domain S-box-containing protein